jgi:hypothetical protein
MLIKEMFDSLELTKYGFKWEPQMESSVDSLNMLWNELEDENLHFEALCLKLVNAGKDDELLLQLFKLRETKKFDRVLEFLESSTSAYFERAE